MQHKAAPPRRRFTAASSFCRAQCAGRKFLKMRRVKVLQLQKVFHSSAMDEQLCIDADRLFTAVGHKFEKNPILPILFGDVIAASDRSNGHKFGAGFFSSEKSHAYWLHGFQFICQKDGLIGFVPPPRICPLCLKMVACQCLIIFFVALFIQFKCSVRTAWRSQQRIQRQASSRLNVGHDSG